MFTYLKQGEHSYSRIGRLEYFRHFCEWVILAIVVNVIEGNTPRFKKDFKCICTLVYVRVPRDMKKQRLCIVCLRVREGVLRRSATASVTRLDDLLDFGQLFKAFGNN